MIRDIQQKPGCVNKSTQDTHYFSLPAWADNVFFGRLDHWNYKTEQRQTLTIARSAADFIQALRTDTDAKRACREAQAIEDEKAREKAKREAKSRIPFWAIMGSYVGADAAQNTLTQLDFDHLQSAEDVARVKDILIELKCALIVSTSASGRGVFAIVDTGGVFDQATLTARCLDPVAEILRARGIEPVKGQTLADISVLEPGHGRVEGYDPALYVAPEYVVFDAGAIKRAARRAMREAQAANDRIAHAAFYTHPIHNIANALRNNATVGSIATAAALSFVASCVNVYSRRMGDGKDRPARAHIVVLSTMGAGKSTMMSAILEARAAIDKNYIVAKPKSDAALAECLKRCGSKIEMSQDGEKTIKRRVPIDKDETPKACICPIDEAGSFLKSAGKNEKCGDIDSAFRQAFDGVFTPPTTKGDMGDDDALLQCLQTNAMIFMVTTQAQWAEYAATEDETNGMLRRRLIFMDDAQGVDVVSDRVPNLLEMIESEPDETINEFALADYAFKLAMIPKKQTFTITRAALAATGRATQALWDAGIARISDASADKNICMTLICNYATLCAAARCAATQCEQYEVTPADMEAVADILSESVCKARPMIAERVEAAGLKRYKTENEVWAEIREYIGDGKRRSHISKWIDHRPPISRNG